MLRKLIFIIACLTACVDSGSRAPAFKVHLSSEPLSLDSALAEDGLSFRVLGALMTGLVSYDKDHKIKLSLAEQMEALNQGRRYRFKLRDWKWSDGREVTAKDFLFALKRALEPETPSKLSELLFFIKGAREYKQGRQKDFEKVGIRALHEKLIEFVLEEPTQFFPHILTLPVALPQRADLVERWGAKWPRHMLTTGPYRISAWRQDARIELERNPHFTQFSDGAPERVTFQIIPDETTALRLFEQRQIDLLFRVPSFDLQRLKRQGLVREFPFFATYYLGFNQKQKPWNEFQARQAFSKAISRDAIVEVLGTHESAAGSWIPKGMPGHDPSIGISFDGIEARRLWNQSGAKSFDSLTLAFDASAKNQTVLERVQADLKSHLGLKKVELRARDWKTYVRELTLQTPSVFRFAWLCPFADAYACLMVFSSKSANNYTGWRSAEYDGLLSKISRLDATSTERRALIDQAQRLLVEKEAVVVPLYHYVQIVGVSPRVERVSVNGQGLIDFMDIQMSAKP
ncbi:MAG: peptide ABC transporter substrate-binding protein [Bdellovibrionota bacterium]